MKNQILFNQLALYVGPAQSSGFHFISTDGVLTNNTGDTSLLFPIHRVQSTSFSINPQRTNISHLGDLGPIKRPLLNNTEVSLNFSYYLMGLINDKRLGIMCNTPSGDSHTGPLLYGTGRVSAISGFYTRDTTKTTETQYNYPLKVREPRNIFIAARKDNFDYNDITTGTFRNSIDVYGFGDCFMSTYGMSVSTNSLPIINVGYSCNNVEVYSSGTNCDIPSVEIQNYNIYSGIKFSVPYNFDGSGLPSVLLPSELSLSIKQRSNNSENLTDFLVDFNDIKIQGFNFSMDLNRNPLYSIIHKFPLDKPIQFPIISNLSLNFIPGDNKAGSLISLIKRDENYDISIKLNYSRGQSFSGTAIQYDFLGAKFERLENSTSITEKNNSNLNFTLDINPLKIDHGFFISGFLSIPSTQLNSTYLTDDFPEPDLLDDILLTEDLDLFAITLGNFKLLYT